MKDLRTFSLIGIVFTGSLFAQTSTSDCDGAIQLCGGVYTESSAPLGTGNVYEFTGTCNQNLESASLWYTFTVQSPGNLSFVLDPANDLDDYDWGLFNITNGGCAGINAQDGTSPEVNCNSYGTFDFNGPTGMSTANSGTGTSNGPGNFNGPPFNADLPVTVGQTYALVVMNWSGSPDGYSIDFTQSTASIYDDTPPVPISVTTDCSNQTFVVEFSEPIVTNTVSPADFTLTSPSGTVIPFSTVTPNDPAATTQPGYTIGLGGVPIEGGNYILTITSDSGNVEDLCGNIVVDTTFQVPIVAPFSYTVDVTNACNGSGGTLQAQYVSGGTVPVLFTLDGAVLPDGSATGLSAGDHELVITDDAGCQVIDAVIVPDHLLEVQIAPGQDSLSCSHTSFPIEGVQVVPEQPVQYSWTALTAAGTDTAFSSSAAPTVSLPGLYTVTVNDPESGCTDQASVVIEATGSNIDLATIQLPNVVSPNGDGMNDVWRPFLPDDPSRNITTLFDVYQLTIYNRWGQVVFDNGGGTRSWDAHEVGDGTYFYTVSFHSECGTVIDKEVSGSITVLR